MFALDSHGFYFICIPFCGNLCISISLECYVCVMPVSLCKAWFPLNRRTIGDSLRQSATVCDVLPILPDLMETLAYDPYDCLGPSAITDRNGRES